MKKNRKNKNIKIIATLGDKGWTKIQNFTKKGANILRINGSHINNYQHLCEFLKKISTNMNKINNNIEIMYDTQGPEIRTIIISNNKNSYYEIKNNDIIIVHTNISDKEVIFKNKKKPFHIGVNYGNFINDVKIGDLITIENRTLYAKIIEKNKKKGIVKLKITSINTENNKYKLTNRRHINLLGKNVSQETLTENDKKYIEKSVLSGVKYYAISFVREKKDIIEVRKLILSTIKKKYKKDTDKIMKNIKIIAKIETRQGLDNLDEITKESDGVMIARGDLSSEIPEEEVPYAKERIILTCNKYKKFSILATNVLEGFIKNNAASLNDIDTIVSALKLGVDAIMLSNETANLKQGEKTIEELKKHINFFYKNN